MSPEEVEVLQYMGQAIIAYVEFIVTRSVLYGTYLAIFAFGIRALLKRSPRTRYTWTLFGFLCLLFLMSTAILAMAVASCFRLIRSVFIDNTDQSITDRLQLADKGVEGLEVAGISLGSRWVLAHVVASWFAITSDTLFADAVVVWRAYVLWPGNKIAKALPSALLLASFGSVIVSAVMDTTSFVGDAVVHRSSPTGAILGLSQSLSLATNVVATTLIGYKAYYHKQMMKTCMGVQSSRTGAILLFMTESGVAFCILQIITFATALADNDANTPLDFSVRTWLSITAFAAAAYPVLVLIIVDTHRSISDHTGGSAPDSGDAHGSNARSLGVGSRLSFAPPPPSLSSDDGGIDTESMMTGSRIYTTSSADHSSEESVRFTDLEKAEELITDTFPTQALAWKVRRGRETVQASEREKKERDDDWT